MKKSKEKLEKLANDLLNKMGFSDLNISASEDENNVYQLQIDASAEDSGLLIGFHGESILALQLVLAQTFNKNEKEWKPIVVNIGDYRQKRESALRLMAVNTAQRVKLIKKPVTLPFLTGNERRIIHLTLSEDEEVETRSEGEGRNRRLIVDLKK